MNSLKKRWGNKYVKALERRYKKSKDSGQTLSDIEKIVLITDYNNPKSKWNKWLQRDLNPQPLSS